MDVLFILKFNLAISILFFILPDYRKFIKIFAPIVALINFIFTLSTLNLPAGKAGSQLLTPYILFDNLSKLIFFFIGFFSFLLSIYSVGYIKERLNKYFFYFFLTVFSSYGVVLSKNFILFIIFWGITAITVYTLSQFSKNAEIAGKKTMIILGGSDTFLLLGIALLYKLNNSFNISSTNFSLLPFICFLIASFSKAGAFPFHTWIPPFADKSPISVTAFLPASLDKLLGIYLLARTFYIFNIPDVIKIIVMILGAFTIISAVFMALAQHGARKLLSYHAVSQVGYMVLGIGTGNPVGIAGGIFHMINNTIYKTSLFLGVGQVEKVKGTDKLEELGGLSKVLPFTFISMFVSALAISGIPPLNGFYSKWLVYQGVIKSLSDNYSLFTVFCLISALFGSALTLASFVKLIHAIFFGVKSEEIKAKENVLLIIPQIILASSCIFLGIFPHLILKSIFQELKIIGKWIPGASLILIILGIILGGVILLIFGINFRTSSSFIGGELINKKMYISGIEFYTSIENLRPFRYIYKLQKKMIFDIYEICKGIILYFSELLSSLHTGFLTNYLSWIFIGVLILFLVFVK
ncbi:MAG: hypothetical protein DRI36_00565 [Caldiserica bacterium]|nr:MAG: hypothetical protein DRI36_00565 [Caldisericota bacterium]